jgi:hypothetical protein
MLFLVPNLPDEQDTRRIEVYHLLLLAVSGYHNSRPEEAQDDLLPEGAQVCSYPTHACCRLLAASRGMHRRR